METKKGRVIALSELTVGECARVKEILLSQNAAMRLFDMGLNPGAFVACLGKSPLGDPRAYLARGRIIALRKTDTERIKCII